MLVEDQGNQEIENGNVSEPQANDVSDDLDAQLDQIWEGKTDDVPVEDIEGKAEEGGENPAEMPAEELPKEEGHDDEVALPKSWKKDMGEDFKALPENVKKYIMERESQVEAGFTKIDDERRVHREYKDILKPYNDLLVKAGDPNGLQTVGTLLEPARILNTGSPDDKVGLLVSLAQQHGVLPAMHNAMLKVQNNSQNTGQNVGELPKALVQQIDHLSQKVNGLTNHQEQKRILEQQQEHASLENEVSNFMSDEKQFPYAEQVLPQMAEILDKGMADSLSDAYQKAIYLNEDIRNDIIKTEADKAAKQSENKKKEAAQKARKMSVSASSSGYSQGVTPAIKTEADLDKHLSALWDGAS